MNTHSTMIQDCNYFHKSMYNSHICVYELLVKILISMISRILISISCHNIDNWRTQLTYLCSRAVCNDIDINNIQNLTYIILYLILISCYNIDNWGAQLTYLWAPTGRIDIGAEGRTLPLDYHQSATASPLDWDMIFSF